MPAAAAGIRLCIKPKQPNELGNSFFGDVPEMGTCGLKELPTKQDEYCKGDSLVGAGFQPIRFLLGTLASAIALGGWNRHHLFPPLFLESA
jgi:hypothetical protein